MTVRQQMNFGHEQSSRCACGRSTLDVKLCRRILDGASEFD